jgi:hypothetical protein
MINSGMATQIDSIPTPTGHRISIGGVNDSENERITQSCQLNLECRELWVTLLSLRSTAHVIKPLKNAKHDAVLKFQCESYLLLTG